MRMPFRPLPLPSLCVALLCLAQPAAAQADRASAEAVKTGFVYNFAKFTEWPAGDDDTAALRLCAPGAQPLDGRLAQLHGRSLQNRTISVHTGVRAAQWKDCHVLFVSAGDAHQLDALLRHTANAPVLTIGDLPGFAQAGGMIGLQEEDKRIRFEINLAAAQRAGLRLSSQMLKLASRVLQ
jgi:hypothetical protein